MSIKAALIKRATETAKELAVGKWLDFSSLRILKCPVLLPLQFVSPPTKFIIIIVFQII